MEEFFARMDRDYDGKLSFEEFMGEETPLERLFHSMDKDGDGAVTKEVDKREKKKDLPIFCRSSFQFVKTFHRSR